MPMPSNKVRGVVQGSINKFWHSQEYVKKTSKQHWQDRRAAASVTGQHMLDLHTVCC
jgi:hypothetical protein